MSQDVQGMLIQIEATTAQLRREMAVGERAVAATSKSMDSQLAKVDSAFDRAGFSAKRLATSIAGAFAGLGAAISVNGILDASMKQENAVRQLEQRIKSTGGVAGVSSRELQDFAGSLQKVTTYGDEAIIEMQGVLLSFTNIRGDTVKGATEAILDVSTALGKSLKESATQVGKALNDPIKGVSALAESGIQFTDSQKHMIRSLVETGDMAAAQTVILRELETQYGGSARAAADTFGGALQQTKNAFGDLLEAPGGLKSAKESLQDLTAVLQDPATVDAANTLTSGLIGGFSLVVDNIGLLSSVLLGVGVASLTTYSAKGLIALKVARDSALASKAQAEAVYQAAVADHRKAQTATILAAREAEAAKGTALQTQMAIQHREARLREAAALNAVGVAHKGLKTSIGTLVGFLGGPMGIAMLAGTAATAFMLLRDNTDKVASSLGDLKTPLEQVRQEFEKLGAAEQRLELTRLSQQIEQEKTKAKTSLDELREAFANSLYGGSGNRAPSPEAEAAIARLGQAMAAASQGKAVNWLEVAESMRGVDGVSATLVEKTLAVAAGQETSARTTTELQARHDALTASVDDGTRAQQAHADALAAASEAGDKYIEQLQNRLNGMVDKTALQAANRFIAENTGLTEQQIAKIRELASAQDAERAAQARATEGRKAGKKSIDEQLAAMDAAVAKALPERKRLEDLTKAQDDLRKAQAAGKITAAELEAGMANLNKQYNDPAVKKRQDEEKKLADQLKKSQDAVQAVIDRLEPAAKAARTLGDEQKLLRESFARGEMSAEQYAKRLGQLEDEYQANQRAASSWGKFTEGALDRIDSAFADTWANIDEGFKGFATNLKDAFRQMLAELAHMAITKPIMVSFANQLMGTNTKGGIGEVWGSLFGGSSGSGGGGLNIGSLLQYGQSAYSALTGVGPAALAGYQSGGLWGGIQGAGGYYGNMLGNAAGTLGGWLGYSGAAASAAAGSTAAGYTGSAYASWVAAQGAGAGAGGIGAGLSGALSSAASMWWLAPIIGAWQSGKLYDAGVRPDASETWAQGGNTALGKIGNVGPTFQSKFFELLDSGLQKGSFGLVDGKIAAMLSGSTFHQALWGGISKKLFGGAWETKDGGIALGADGGGLDAQQYIYQKKKGGLFSSSKKRTRYSELDDETAALLQETYAATEAGVASIFEALSLSVDEGSLAGLQLARTQISTKGKTEEEISQAISEWFGGLGEAMNAELNKVFATGLGYDLAGMQAFVGNLEGVNAIFDQLNLTLYESSVAGGRMAEQLSAVAGGLDVLAANTATYYDAFYSAEEKTANTLAAITKAFEATDVALVGSAAEYRAMVENIDRTTDAGREMFATMMALSGHAAQYFAIVEQQTAALLGGAVDGAYSALQRSFAKQQKQLTDAYNARLGSLNDMAGTAAANVAALAGISNSLDAALKRLRGSSDDTVRMLRAQATATLRAALASTQAGGSLKDAEGLQDALDIAAQMDAALYSSLEDFEREQGRTANLVAALEAINGKQLSVEERTLQSLQTQIDLAKQQFDEQMQRLDAQAEFAQAQLDALNGVDTNVLSVVDAIKAMNEAVVAALQGLGKDAGKANTPQNNATLISSVYQTVLGRAADDGGAAYWQQQLATGAIRIDQLEQAVRNAAVANGSIPAFATGGFHSGGPFIAGEFGPELVVTGPARIYNANQTAAMAGGSGGSDATAAEVRALRAEVRVLGQALSNIDHNTDEARKALRSQNEVGVPTWSG